ncbi:MAG TPA: type I 3-dehydroquinate dehydratase [Acidobacteriota bacterium]|nr:type I 3-dehydroquinate dehydratase [Acidobacteriota bacterium]
MPPICLTLACPDRNSLQQAIQAHSGSIAWIEVRLDALDKPRLPSLPRPTSTRFVATCRPSRQGGGWTGSERERLELLQEAARAGFAWIDLEHDVERGLDLPSQVSVLRSLHDFQGMPDSLDSAYHKLRQRGDGAKLAVTVKGTAQLVKLLDFMAQLAPQESRVVLGMGEYGQPSRLLGAFLGNLWTYVAEDQENLAAPGQFGLGQARLYRLESWSEAPPFYGVLGRPVAQSLSPLLHNRLMAHHGVPGIYLPLLVDDLAAWMGWLQRTPLQFRGLSVTLPYKQKIIPFLSENDSPIDSVNTLRRLAGPTWRGINTDYQGFLSPLLKRRRLAGETAVVLGNGGVARTVVKALLDQRMQVTVVGRNQQRVQTLAQDLGCRHATFQDLPIEAQVCVNTTPVGQHPDEDASPLPAQHVRFEVVYDLIYNPRHTKLLNEAQSRGAEVISGLEMFVEQAALQFRFWTGIDPDRRFMERILREVLEARDA